MPDSPESAARIMVAFTLDRQLYALPIEPIVQIVEMCTITPIPQANHAVEGVITVRGAPVPVINLRRHLALPEAPLQLHTPIILVNLDGRLVGLIVDQVTDVIQTAAGQVVRPSDILPPALSDAPFLRALVRTRQGIVLLLDLEQLFAGDAIRNLAAVVGAIQAQAAHPVEEVGAP